MSNYENISFKLKKEITIKEHSKTSSDLTYSNLDIQTHVHQDERETLKNYIARLYLS